ncbi:MAG: flavin-containing monooxygenase [Acidimicrobiales bacterium]
MAGAGGIDHEVVVIGAGFGGIGSAVELNRAGIEDYVILEKWTGVGGCWLANTYPGVAVDIPSFVYSFSYEQRSDWSRLFAPGDELRRDAEDVTTKHGLWPHIRFGVTVVAATFDDDADLWRLTLSSEDGPSEMTARWVIGALGPLERPAMPDIEGLDSFEGPVMHTARWDHDCEHTGRRVSVLGTGASALQLIPEIAPDVAQLDVYQRTPIWVAPKLDGELEGLARMVLSNPALRTVLRAVGTAGTDVIGNVMLNRRLRPLANGIEVGLRRWMRSQVDDPDVADQLIPAYGFGCKRPSMSNTYLRTFNRSNVALVTDPIERITATGIVTASGDERAADLLVCATGFKLMTPGDSVPFPTFGRNGVELGAHWDQHRFGAYQGVSVPGFPNLFSIAGPYGFVAGSYFWMLESTAAHAVRVIAYARRRGATRAEVRADEHDRYVERCRTRQHGSPLFSDVCAGSNTYYVNAQGDSPLRPSLYAEMWWENRHFPLDAYRYRTAVTGDEPRRSSRPLAVAS